MVRKDAQVINENSVNGQSQQTTGHNVAAVINVPLKCSLPKYSCLNLKRIQFFFELEVLPLESEVEDKRDHAVGKHENWC